MRRSIALISTLAAAVAMTATAAARPASKPTFAVAPARPLVAQSSCTEASDRMLDWAAYWAVESQFYRHWARTEDVARGSEGAPAAQKAAGGAAAPAPSGPGNYTRTNVQEVGVDEADLVKTDGRHVYTVNGRDVVIVKSWPANRVHVIARYGLPAHVQPQSLFLDGDRLVVLSQVHEQLARPARAAGKRSEAAARVAHPYPYANNYFQGTRVTVLDIADRSRPRLVHEADIEGYMAQARMIGDDVYLVSNAQMSIPAAVQEIARRRAEKLLGQVDYRDHERMMAAKQRAYRAVRQHLDERIGRASLVAAMPRQRHASAGGSMSSLRPLYACSELLVPPGGGQLGTLNVVHFDIDDPARIDAVGVLASGWQIYASTDALYAAMPNHGWYHLWGWGAQPSQADYNATNIHKFDLRGAGDRPRYAASGRVRGHILNQFSMSEHDGHLRVATTDQSWGAGQGGNHLYVMAERGPRMVTVGAIEDLAPGERIYSARMMGDKGYMVTFRQTDPLFTLDLSNPRRPRVAGELKINGFSSYIHPLDGDHLLTIGQDATDEGRVRGAHVQVFDVSDPARPRRTAHRLLVDENGWSSSSAQWDHHAFTYDPRTRVLAVPMTAHGSDPSNTFLGLMVLQVAKDSFEELGRISHARLSEMAHIADCGRQDRAQPCAAMQPRADWRTQIQRSIVMDDVILSLSSLGIQVNDLTRPERTIARLLLTPPVAMAAR